MSQEIYNEGRVVGYSAWELYVKQTLTDDPEATPATEREWLAETIGNGKSIVLHVPAAESTVTGTYTTDLKLPTGTSLCAAQTIIGSLFLGEVQGTVDATKTISSASDVTYISSSTAYVPDVNIGDIINVPSDVKLDSTAFEQTVPAGAYQLVKYYTSVGNYAVTNDGNSVVLTDTTYWKPVTNFGVITRVSDYGLGLANDAKEHTSVTIPQDGKKITSDTITSILPYQTSTTASSLYSKVKSYAKIFDGLVLQPGTYKLTTDEGQNPYLDLIEPDFTDVPVVRLTFIDPPAADFYLLLTGFSNSTILQGESSIGGGSTSTANPQNGDFLGPVVFPWASKIVFTAPPYLADLKAPSITAGDHVSVETTSLDPTVYKINVDDLVSTNNYLKVDGSNLTVATPQVDTSSFRDTISSVSIASPSTPGGSYILKVAGKEINTGQGIGVSSNSGIVTLMGTRMYSYKGLLSTSSTDTKTTAYNYFSTSATVPDITASAPSELRLQYDVIYQLLGTTDTIDYVKLVIHFKSTQDSSTQYLYNPLLYGEWYVSSGAQVKNYCTFNHGNGTSTSYNTSRICSFDWKSFVKTAAGTQLSPTAQASLDKLSLSNWYQIGNDMWTFHGSSRTLGTQSNQWSFPVYTNAKADGEYIVIAISGCADTYGENPESFASFRDGESQAKCRNNKDILNLTMELEFY